MSNTLKITAMSEGESPQGNNAEAVGLDWLSYGSSAQTESGGGKRLIKCPLKDGHMLTWRRPGGRERSRFGRTSPIKVREL